MCNVHIIAKLLPNPLLSSPINKLNETLWCVTSSVTDRRFWRHAHVTVAPPHWWRCILVDYSSSPLMTAHPSCRRLMLVHGCGLYLYWVVFFPCKELEVPIWICKCKNCSAINILWHWSLGVGSWCPTLYIGLQLLTPNSIVLWASVDVSVSGRL